MVERLAATRWFWWGIFVAWWAFFTATFAVTGYYSRVTGGQEAAWSDAILISAVNSATWGATAFLAFQLAWRLPLDGGRWRRSLPLHAVAAVVILSARASFYFFLGRQVAWIPEMPLLTRLQGVPVNLVWYTSFVGVGLAISFYRRFREGELRTLHLEADLARTQLQALRMQLQPHFLFTTLAGISELMHRDVRAADRMLARLGDLLRLMLERRGSEEVSLREELEFMRLYLEIERMRVGEDRLFVETSIDPDTLDAQVPHLILQPLVENALRVGLAACAGPAHVSLSAQRVAGELHVDVRARCNAPDAGAPALAGAAPELATARTRLAQLYAGSHRLELAPAPRGGQIVRMAIPFQAPQPAGALAAG